MRRQTRGSPYLVISSYNSDRHHRMGLCRESSIFSLEREMPLGFGAVCAQRLVWQRFYLLLDSYKFPDRGEAISTGTEHRRNANST